MNDHQDTVARLSREAASASSAPHERAPWYRCEFKITARLAAAYLIPVSVLGLWWNWHLAHTKGEYYPKIAVMAPAILVVGLFLLAFPAEDPTVMPRPLRLRHWAAYSLALLAGLANWWAMRNGLY